MQPRTKLAISAVVILLIPASAYVYFRSLINADIAAAKALESEMIATATKTSRRGLSSELRQRYDQMSDGAKHEFRKTMMQKRQTQMEAELASFFSLPPKQRAAHLDKKIRDSAKRRKESESRENGEGRGGRGRGRPDRGPESESKSPEEREVARDQMKRRMLDHTSPKLRAQMSEYRRAMNERREELGLPSRGRRGWG